ncbi:putative baseplate assembly protein [Streptomyces durmitorensis]|uniref:Baseplate assembly protein n=1 Tax=Streptomyces durmitorensis TaxID=319947 RepID=A0ABY4Q3D1_9ACTN|nr:putative baseplate assembly protein [Streptomyces durmitorensis]UQT60683.1 putative baseplate assembly protein [Streptomyces durmitorensis]
MTGRPLECRDEQRRKHPRVNGLDRIEVSEDQLTLTVLFLGRAPEGIARDTVRIDHRPGALAVQVDDVDVRRAEGPGADDCMVVRVTAPGDYSTYTLRLVVADERGRPTDRPLPGLDPRYARLEFSFKANCLEGPFGGLDCKTEPVCDEPLPSEPEIDYLAKDYASFRRLILDRLSLVLPDWQERHVPDLGIVLTELLAYVGDHLSYHQDAVATEAYLATARQRVSVRRHAKLVDYTVHEGCNARVFVALETDADRVLDPGQVQFLAVHGSLQGLPAVLTPDDLQRLPFGGYEVFEPLGDGPVQLRRGHNLIPFHTWGNRDCVLPAGATAATLLDRGRRLALRVSDVLILEEVKGSCSGEPQDADRSRRHAVRLTSVDASGVDPYSEPPGAPVVEIEWAEEDALPFPLCLSAVGRAPQCALITDISMARGNVVAADHGRTVHREPLGTVAAEETPMSCLGEGRPAETAVVARPFTPSLRQLPLTHREPYVPDAPASRLAVQDPRRALPQISLAQRGGAAPPGGSRWAPRPDLLDSGPGAREFVVETDNEGRAHLRFGDGRLGWRPEAGTRLVADYRVGNGPAGNVGAGSISRLLLRDGSGDTGGIRPGNPLPAAGGQLPETLDDVKSLAPVAFRTRIERAITEDDYAMLAARGDDAGPARVQRAAATFRWTGSWYEVLTTIDPLGLAQPDEELLRQVERRLRRYRRIGHDLVVAPAAYVPLDVGLCVCVEPGFVQGRVRAALLDALGNRGLSGGRRGFFHPDNLTFGQGVSVSRLTAAALTVPGVASAEVTKLERLFAGPNGELCDGVLRIGPGEVARLDNDPAAPEQGQLLLILRGGR